MAKRVCAYCGSEGALTNEHVFPDCILQRKRGKLITVARTARGDKAVGGALEIGDVCARCNNERLSPLDAYICELHDQYFKTVVCVGDRVDFRFDFDRLLRWLLKTGYNFARARHWSVGSGLTELTDYILGHAARPHGFRVFLQLVIPTPTASLEWVTKPEVEEILPPPQRIDLLDLSQLAGFNMAYIVSLNSYVFHVFKESQRAPLSIRRRELRNRLKQIPGGYEITDKGRATIYSSSVDFMASVKGNTAFHRHVEMAKKHHDQLKRKREGHSRN